MSYIRSFLIIIHNSGQFFHIDKGYLAVDLFGLVYGVSQFLVEADIAFAFMPRGKLVPVDPAPEMFFDRAHELSANTLSLMFGQDHEPFQVTGPGTAVTPYRAYYLTVFDGLEEHLLQDLVGQFFKRLCERRYGTVLVNFRLALKGDSLKVK